MLDSLYKTLEKKATWALVTFLFIAYLFCTAGFDWRSDKFGTENSPLDTRFLYDPLFVKSLFSRLGAEKLKIYAITELTLDVVFPLVYVSLLVFLIIRVFPRGKAKYLILLPILGGLFDLSENFSVAFLALTFDGQQSNISYLASIFTTSKLILLPICLVILLIGAIWRIWKKEES